MNSKAGKAIKHVKTTAQANVQDADGAAQNRDKVVRVRSELRPDTLNIDATLIEFREWLTTFRSYFYGSNLQNDHLSGQQAIYKQLLDTELRRRVAPECGADTPVFTPNPNPNNIASLISIIEKYLKKEHPLNSRRAQWLRARQANGEDFDCFFRRVLALGKESEAHTFDETAGNIMVLCAGATSDSFRRELRLKGRALTLENIQELADDSRRAEKEEQGMNALRDKHVRAVGKGGARPRNTQTTRNRGQTSGKRPCNRCGKDNHTTSECTIPRSVKCSKCEKLGHIGPACRGGKPWQPAPTMKQATQGRVRQVAPNETDDTTPAGSESVQAVSRQASDGRRSPLPAFYV